MELRKPISYADLESWARLTGRNLSRREISALILLDAVLHEVLLR